MEFFLKQFRDSVFFPVCLCVSSFTNNCEVTYSGGLQSTVDKGPSILLSLTDITGNVWGQLRDTQSIIIIAYLWGYQREVEVMKAWPTMLRNEQAPYTSWRWIGLMIFSTRWQMESELALQATWCLGQQKNKTLHDSERACVFMLPVYETVSSPKEASWCLSSSLTISVLWQKTGWQEIDCSRRQAKHGEGRSALCSWGSFFSSFVLSETKGPREEPT